MEPGECFLFFKVVSTSGALVPSTLEPPTSCCLTFRRIPYLWDKCQRYRICRGHSLKKDFQSSPSKNSYSVGSPSSFSSLLSTWLLTIPAPALDLSQSVINLTILYLLSCNFFKLFCSNWGHVEWERF